MGNERSQFWDTAGAVGDGADTYSAVQLREMLRALFTTDRYANEGVLAGVLNGLAVSGSTSPLTVATGNAVVQGIYYLNDAAKSITVTTPTTGTTGHRVVLQADWNARTVRAVLISSSDGTSAAPALTQQDNSKWEISLVTLTIDTAGAITLTDVRDFAHYASALVYRRQGGSSSAWATAGTTAYRVGGVKRQGGTATVSWTGSSTSDTLTVTFPSAFSQTPLVWLTVINGATSNAQKCQATVDSISATNFKIKGKRTDSTSWTQDLSVQWFAEGAE